MHGDIFATARRWRGRLLPTGHPASRAARRRRMMMLLFIGTHSVTTTLNVHSRSRSFVGAIDLRGLVLEHFGDALAVKMKNARSLTFRENG